MLRSPGLSKRRAYRDAHRDSREGGRIGTRIETLDSPKGVSESEAKGLVWPLGPTCTGGAANPPPDSSPRRVGPNGLSDESGVSSDRTPRRAQKDMFQQPNGPAPVRTAMARCDVPIMWMEKPRLNKIQGPRRGPSWGSCGKNGPSPQHRAERGAPCFVTAIDDQESVGLPPLTATLLHPRSKMPSCNIQETGVGRRFAFGRVARPQPP